MSDFRDVIARMGDKVDAADADRALSRLQGQSRRLWNDLLSASRRRYEAILAGVDVEALNRKIDGIEQDLDKVKAKILRTTAQLKEAET